MLTLRKAQDRGYADHGWLKSFHSFSFAGYHDPRFMGWGNLRVINEDKVAAGMGFGKHGHRNMEIISYVLSGQLAHEDSMGNIKGIPPGDVQRMSAGTGVTHSEFNHAKDQTTHFLQIWIEPNVMEIPPSYEQKSIPPSAKQNKLCLIASPDGSGNAIKIHADARIYVGLFDGHHSQKLDLDLQRKAYVHLIRGSLHVNDILLSSGDALLIENESSLLIGDGKDAEVLVFDLSSE
ncbi:pirin family protein [Polynucleobacter sp. AP-Sving-400A-A2]|uniref:pirin family protein n=1 Tax=Polynucleobacter sp. AP-Sving-400A-A2 TaxID=2081049 RepID=UPI001BFEBCEB|nr:pirin family protein [Polynucleobacter sp. AP-Sving-400A-A2]QWE15167.1 pirin family protein [Polynucleobacter sp. AP-Sving-400A-A2]